MHGRAGDRHRFAVVGAGPAGITVAWRLAEAGEDVALIEAGPGPPFPPTVTGIDLVASSADDRHLWADSVAGTGRPYRQGRGLGGGALVNGMLLGAGDAADYDRWRDRYGCAGWGATDMAPWIERARSGLATSTSEPGPLSFAFEAAAAAAGHPTGGTSMDPDRAGSLVAVTASRRGRRSMPFDRFGAGPAPALMVGAEVQRIEPAAGGIALALAGGDRTVAEHVVVCGGAIRTPRLLRRSGLVRPEVRFELKDHPSFAFAVRRAGLDPGGPRVVSRLLRWSSDVDDAIDLQAFVVDSVETGPTRDGTTLGVVVVGLTTVTSTGAPGEDGDPIDPGSLEQPSDRVRLRRGVRHVGRLLETMKADGSVAEVHLDEVGTPLDALRAMTDDDLDRLLIANPGPYAHPACTVPLAPLPRASRATVDGRAGRIGRLHGGGTSTSAITVADASVFPDLVGSGLQLPVAAVAERIAADLLAR